MIHLKWQDAAMIVGAIVLIGFFVGNSNRTDESHTTYETYKAHARLDTARVMTTIPLAEIRASGQINRTKTIRIHDTLYTARCLDTLLHSDPSALAPDTISVCMARDQFCIAVGLSPRRKEIAVPYIARDTFYSRIDTIRISDRAPWYEQLLTILLSVAAGVLVGRL